MPPPLALFSDVGGTEILVIGIIALLLFGKNLPSVSRNVGKVIAEFKRGLSDASAEIHREMNAAAEVVDGATREARDAARVDLDDKPRAAAGAAAPLSAAPTGLGTSAASVPARGPLAPPPAVSAAAALDTLHDIPPPTNIPPPVL